MATKTMKVDLVNLMIEMANNTKTPASTIGVKIAIGCLERISARACELNDPAILKELEILMLVGPEEKKG